ncbi:MAG: hypothetical protein HC821_04005, partial [Lewinella sp.]|nr:hypothetical protein [Lewinella sp.]
MRILSTALATMVALGLYGQILPPLPASAPPTPSTDKCYALCYIPQKWNTVTENVQTYGGGSRLAVAQPTYQTITERVMVKPASYRLVNVPAEYNTVEEKVEIAPAYTEYILEAAKFETVTERILVEDGATSYKVGQPQFTTVTNANLYYGSPEGTTFKSSDYGNILDAYWPQ